MGLIKNVGDHGCSIRKIVKKKKSKKIINDFER